MKTYILNGKPFEVEEHLRYLDCFISASKPKLEPVFPDYYLGMLARREAELGRSAWDRQYREFFRQASRWVHETERQRFHQELIRIGKEKVLDRNYTFDGDEAHIIDALENRGSLALRVLMHYSDKDINSCYPSRRLIHVVPLVPKDNFMGGQGPV
jgi:hypothetical protein